MKVLRCPKCQSREVEARGLVPFKLGCRVCAHVWKPARDGSNRS